MHRVAKSYYQSGGNANVTLKDNLEAFDNVKLNRSAEIDIQKFKGISTTILGQKVASPICIVSTAYQRMAHPEGEVATSRAAESIGIP